MRQIFRRFDSHMFGGLGLLSSKSLEILRLRGARRACQIFPGTFGSLPRLHTLELLSQFKEPQVSHCRDWFQKKWILTMDYIDMSDWQNFQKISLIWWSKTSRTETASMPCQRLKFYIPGKFMYSCQPWIFLLPLRILLQFLKSFWVVSNESEVLARNSAWATRATCMHSTYVHRRISILEFTGFTLVTSLSGS